MSTQVEKIFIRENGLKIKAKVGLEKTNYPTRFYFTLQLSVCEFRKRTWYDPVNTDGYEFRRLDHKGRYEYCIAEKLKYISKEEILKMQLDMWELIKPSMDNLFDTINN